MSIIIGTCAASWLLQLYWMLTGAFGLCRGVTISEKAWSILMSATVLWVSIGQGHGIRPSCKELQLCSHHSKVLVGILQSNCVHQQNVDATITNLCAGPGYNFPPYMILFHPASGLCIVQDNANSPFRLGSCSNAKALNYTEQQTIQLLGTNLCWKQSGAGSRVTLESCSDDSRLRWELVSDSMMHVSSGSERNLCLDVNYDGDLVTSQCRCLSMVTSCDPVGQWFAMVSSTKPL